MSMEGDSGEMIVRMTLDGIERTVRISGTTMQMTGKLLIFLAAALSKGKARDIALNPGGMCTVTIPEEKQAVFTKIAGQYHLKFFVAKDRLEQGLCDVCARNEDAQILSRICEKLGIGVLEKSVASIENAVDFETAAKALQGRSMSFDKALNRITENDFSKDTPRFLCERTDPGKYIEMYSSYEDFAGEQYTKTRYTVFKNGGKYGEFNDGRFKGRKPDFWSKTKNAMKRAGGFSDDVVFFNEKSEFDHYKALYGEKDLPKAMEAHDLKRQVEEEIGKYSAGGKDVNPQGASERTETRSEAGAKDTVKDAGSIKRFIGEYTQKVKNLQIPGRSRAKGKEVGR